MRTDGKYVKSILNKRNEFRINAEFTLFGHKSIVDDLKIDTGCGYTTIPIKRLGIYTDKDILALKENDIDLSVKYMISYGVETGGQTHRKPITRKDFVECKALGFFKDISGFNIGNVEIGDRIIRVNYDRTGNILLGMDILKDWDIHIGTGRFGDTVFIGCPKDKLNEEFYDEVEKEFGYRRAGVPVGTPVENTPLFHF